MKNSWKENIKKWLVKIDSGGSGLSMLGLLFSIVAPMLIILIDILITYILKISPQLFSIKLSKLSYILMGVGIILALIGEIISKKYIKHYRKFFESYNQVFCHEGNEQSEIKIMQTKGGKVINYGNSFWSKDKKNISFIVLPVVSDEGNFETSISLDKLYSNSTIKLRATCIKHNRRIKAFDPEELNNFVIKKGYKSVRLWLAETFKTAIEKSPTLQIAVAKFISGQKTVKDFSTEVQKSLKDIYFYCPLTNISTIEVSFELSPITVSIEKKYTGNGYLRGKQ